MAERTKSRVNDFVLKLANVNGTGSASANSLLMKAIFRMGVPVSGKNFFPSNIQGLPTWYEIRVSSDGYVGRSGAVDVMVAMNAETYARTCGSEPGRLPALRLDVAARPPARAPTTSRSSACLSRGCATSTSTNARTRILMKNMAYVGALAALLELDRKRHRGARHGDVRKQAGADRVEHEGDRARARLRERALRVPAADCASSRMDKTPGHIMIDGNTAAALGCVYAGATVGAWYPITPSTSLMDAFKGFCERYRKDPKTGEKHYCIVQAEDELAAIGIVLGASWNGARAFTPTSGPGISLMNEFLGFAYLRGAPGRDFRRAARRSVDRHADAHATGRSSCLPRSRRTATRSTCCCSRATRASASSSRSRRSTSRSAYRRR